MSRRLTQARTYARLGPTSIARVAAYRLALKSGRHPVQRLAAPVAQPPFFRAVDTPRPKADPNCAWDDRLWWFGWHNSPLPDAAPDWFANPFSTAPQPDATRDWWRIPDFGTGDIKGLWELSRMDWAVAWATTAACGDAPALERLNLWLADWAERNPPYKGPNWKCGQEASIRVMHLVAAAWVLGQDQAPEAGLADLLRAHLQRIAPTMSYAIGQENNHGTSEAAALFIGGNFLAGHDPRADAWACKGRRWLEERAAALIEPDGSFSQYSVTYHRVMLDTYALAEAWRRHRGLPAFSDRLRGRLVAATGWLRAMTDPETGDAPNIGANDGARLLQLTGTDYRDFRPSVQLAAALFQDGDAFGPGPWSAPLRWLGVPDGQRATPLHSASFDDGGYHVLRTGQAMAVLRYAQGNTGLSMPFENARRRGVVDGIDVIEFALNYGNHMGFMQRIGVFLKFAVGSVGVALREPADVVFATTTPLTAGIPGIFARWLKRKPFVFEVRDLWPELPKAMGVITNPVVLWLMSVLEWASYRSADRLVGLSPGIVEGIAARGVDKSRIAMVPNGCDMDLFSTPEAAWRPDGVQDDQLLAIFTGTHGNANGLDAVLNAATVLKERGREDIRIALVGQGREKPKLKVQAKERGLDNVLFLVPVPKIKLSGLMAGADIGLQVLRNVPAFYYGTSPNKFFDYISAGLPVLNNYPGWLAGLIEETDCGFAVPPDDPTAFADALIAAASDREALRQKGFNAQDLAKTRFARAKLSSDWVEWVTGAAR